MSRTKWVQWVMAAVVVVLAGALIASAEERIEVRVEAEDDEISVDVNGVTEVVHLDDLDDGESRTVDVGDHELVIQRVGDELTIVSDGHAFGSFGRHHESLDTMVWVTDGDETIEIDGDCEFAETKVVVMKMAGEAGEHGQAKAYKIHIDGDDVLLDENGNVDIEEIIASHGHGDHGAIFVSEDGNVHHPKMMGLHQLHGNMVKYRCEETGSTLLVKKDDAIEDVYICPATGCVMTKVEEPEVRVITIEKRIEIDDED